jgi:molybdopterin molybdotransferase
MPVSQLPVRKKLMGDTMISYENALKIIKAETAPLNAEETSLSSALNRVLAADIYAVLDQPPFARSPLDGYAFHAADTAKASAENAACFRVVGVISAGSVRPGFLQKGTAVRIFTGAMLPPGADAVVAQEETVTEGERVFVIKRFRSGENVVPAGEDIAKNSILLNRGMILGPADIGMLASQGMTHIPVYRKPRVAILSSGNELVDPGELLPEGKIFNSNRYTLEALVTQAGGIPICPGMLLDRLDLLTDAFISALDEADILLITGGVSVGDYDLVPAAVKETGARLLFHRVDIKPGTPTLAAIIGKKLLFGLSGNPAACLVGFLQFALPALKILQGIGQWEHTWIDVTLAMPYTKTGRQARFLSAQTVYHEGCFRTTVAGKQKPGVLTSFREMNSLVFIPEDKTVFQTGDTVRAQLYPDFFASYKY